MKMFFKFKKLLAYITLGFLSASALAFDGPPGNEISKLGIRIDTDEGMIYANGNMQAEVHVYYELVEGAQIKAIRLIDRNTRQPLQDSPYWFVDTTENGYLHVISYNENRSSTGLPSLKTGEVYVRRYVRASRIDNVDVCLEIETMSGSMRDTCINGETVTLKAIAPVVIDSTDFELQYATTLVHDADRRLEQWYLKVRDPKLAPGLKIEFMQTDRYSNDLFGLHSNYAAVRDYQLWDASSAFVGAWLLRPHDFNKARFHSLDGNYIDVNLIHSGDTSIVAEVLHYETHRARILAGQRECWRHDSTLYYCTIFAYTGGMEYVLKEVIHNSYIEDKVPSRVNVTDQFGNQGYFTLDYPNGGDDLVLR
ncbi:hypothetical protein [Vibrio aestuarianus]|uniref:hypothetical protein n=1 Tax=Vibrio aestuarianus TaxID=28171 RepID=UPI00237C99C5|nr:hypothetical protein [Vibrio aestuarianus]MDE1337377.1 hypothetical protein [Vibrio aestuarianus]